MALLSFCVHLLHEELPLDAVLVPSQESLPFTRGERTKRKERFVPDELASYLLTFPLGWLRAVADSKSPRREAGGAMDTSEVAVHQAEMYYVTKTHLAPHQHSAGAGGLYAEGF